MKWMILITLVLALHPAFGQSDKNQCSKACLGEMSAMQADIQRIKATSPKMEVISKVAVPPKGEAAALPAEIDLKPFWENILLIQVSVGQNAMYIPFFGDMQGTNSNPVLTSFRLPFHCRQSPGLIQAGALTVSLSERKLFAAATGCPLDVNFEVTFLLKM